MQYKANGKTTVCTALTGMMAAALGVGITAWLTIGRDIMTRHEIDELITTRQREIVVAIETIQRDVADTKQIVLQILRESK